MTHNGGNMARTETRAEKIARLKPMKDPDTGEIIRHEWLDAYSAQDVFVKLFINNPDYKFGKTFEKPNEYNMYSEVEDYWSQDIEYDKHRDGKEGFITDAKGKVRTDVPVIRRYIVGRRDSKNRLIEGLINTFSLFPDAFPNKDKILENLKEQKKKKVYSTGSATAQPPITPKSPKTVKVAWKSTCAAVPMKGLYQHINGTDWSFDEDWNDTVKVELVDKGDKSYYRISIEGREPA